MEDWKSSPRLEAWEKVQADFDRAFKALQQLDDHDKVSKIINVTLGTKEEVDAYLTSNIATLGDVEKHFLLSSLRAKTAKEHLKQ